MTSLRQHEEDLSPEDLEFLGNLPQITAEIDDFQHISGAADDTEILIAWLDGQLPKTSVLIFTVKGNVDGRSRLVRLIGRVGRYASFASIEPGRSRQQDRVYQGVSRKLETFGKKISPNAFNLLQSRTGNDMHLIAEAIEKIIAFVGDKTRVDERDIETVIAQSSFENIFALTDALGRRSVSASVVQSPQRSRKRRTTDQSQRTHRTTNQAHTPSKTACRTRRTKTDTWIE